MSLQTVGAIVCLFLAQVAADTGVHFVMERHPDSYFCGHLQCVADLTKSDQDVSTCVEMTIYDITRVNSELKLASVSAFHPDLYVDTTKSSAMSCTGIISRLRANLTLKLRHDIDCLYGVYKCQLDFVTESGHPEVLTEIVIPENNHSYSRVGETKTDKILQVVSLISDKFTELKQEVSVISNKLNEHTKLSQDKFTEMKQDHDSLLKLSQDKFTELKQEVFLIYDKLNESTKLSQDKFTEMKQDHDSLLKLSQDKFTEMKQDHDSLLKLSQDKFTEIKQDHDSLLKLSQDKFTEMKQDHDLLLNLSQDTFTEMKQDHDSLLKLSQDKFTEMKQDHDLLLNLSQDTFTEMKQDHDSLLKLSQDKCTELKQDVDSLLKLSQDKFTEMKQDHDSLLKLSQDKFTEMKQDHHSLLKLSQDKFTEMKQDHDSLLKHVDQLVQVTPLNQDACIKAQPHINGAIRITLWGGTTALCDTTTDQGGWIIIQRRTNGDVNFYRGWNEYKTGFGNLDTSFWLGNDAIHLLADQGYNELRIDMIYEGRRTYAHYFDFNVASEALNYQLTVGAFEGTAGDSLTNHNNMYFSSFDRDNDKTSSNCADARKGAWWYNSCHYSNLNALWGEQSINGMNWHALTGWKSVSFSEMKVRRG